METFTRYILRKGKLIELKVPREVALKEIDEVLEEEKVGPLSGDKRAVSVDVIGGEVWVGAGEPVYVKMVVVFLRGGNEFGEEAYRKRRERRRLGCCRLNRGCHPVGALPNRRALPFCIDRNGGKVAILSGCREVGRSRPAFSPCHRRGLDDIVASVGPLPDGDCLAGVIQCDFREGGALAREGEGNGGRPRSAGEFRYGLNDGVRTIGAPPDGDSLSGAVHRNLGGVGMLPRERKVLGIRPFSPLCFCGGLNNSICPV